MKKVLQLSVVPNVDRYNKRLEDVRKIIHDTIDIALVDFMMVSSVFKKYQLAQHPLSGGDAARISLSVRELQYMDVFTQKLGHIIKLNKEIIEAPLSNSNVNIKNADHAGFIFKLNYIQVAVASEEFFIKHWRP